MDRQRRRRPALPCVQCRHRKIKCDRNSPCAHCVSTRTQCVYKVYRNENRSPRPTAENGSNQMLDPPTAGPSSIPGQAQHAQTHRQRGIPITPGRVFTEPSTRPQHPDLLNILHRVQRLEEELASRASNKNESKALTCQSRLQHSEIILNKTRILRWSHWMGAAPEPGALRDSYAFSSVEVKALIDQMSDLMQRCKQVAQRIKLGRPHPCHACSVSGLAPPSRGISDKMVSLYFHTFESTYRILHAPTFRTEYQKYWANSEDLCPGLRFEILLVIAIGSSLYHEEDTGPELRNMAKEWIEAAQNWLAGPVKKDRRNITGVQVHCLLILARQLFSIGGGLVWMSMGTLMNTAMQIGLHRDPKYLPTMPLLQAEVRRRLWTTVLELTVQTALDAAMPHRISLDEFDTEAPSNYDDDEIDESGIVLQPHSNGTYTETSIQLILLKSLPIRLRILQLLNGLHSELSYLHVLALSSEVAESYQECNHFSNENKIYGLIPFHRNMLDFLVRRFMIPLHCPFAGQARTKPLFYYSSKACLETAMNIITPEPGKDFSRLMAIGGGIFREAIRLSTAVVTLELLGQRNSQYRDLLKKAVRSMIDLSLERIREGETNIKSHMFLCMIIAQVEAVELSVSCEFKIVQSAIDSLKFCHGLLHSRLDMVSGDVSPAPFSITPESGQGDFELDFDLEFFFPDITFP
ncbi:hypothetical protein EJ08DRAFT_673615 [Tothia fuscella]|uniref:Zn(2)-C6 fungal-type domain-containing protein n=1 Tax=Tothia fuscella TaxID=1048955 RepID=A0A9P4NEX1_9PEZI|nr:hypothetical protein EJ08DRAFT_673615 [Tothia fuscella]